MHEKGKKLQGGDCLRVAIYARVSTEDQHLEQQIEPLKEKCLREKWVYDIFAEKISGAKAKRTELDAMMQGVRNGDYDAVMVYKIDRLGRSTMHLVNLVEEFKKLGVKFISLTQGIDTTTPVGKLFFTIISSIGEFEREMIRERTKARLEHIKATGGKLGRPKGSKDKRPRRKSGYYNRWAGGKRNNPKGKRNLG